jgi:thiamine pyrophosphokinase
MTLANVMLLAASFLRDRDVRILDGRDTLRLLTGGNAMELQGAAGDGLSLIPLTEAPFGITLHGLEYPLKDAMLGRGATRGVSNVFKAETASVVLGEGLLLVVHTRG